MSTAAYAVRDSATMLRRNLRHLQRYPGLSLYPILMPVVLLLLFVYVFGGTLGNGITTGGGRGAYINFLAPGMLLFTVAGAANITAISVAKDMTEGIIARFKTMRIWRPAVLAGHVLGSLMLTAISLAVVIGVSLLAGFHTGANPLQWLAALALLGLTSVALIWLTIAFGLFTEERRDREQHPDVPHPAAPPFLEERLRPGPLDARRTALVRTEISRSRRSPTPSGTCSPGTRPAAPASRRSCGASRSAPRRTCGRGTCTTAGRRRIAVRARGARPARMRADADRAATAGPVCRSALALPRGHPGAPRGGGAGGDRESRRGLAEGQLRRGRRVLRDLRLSDHRDPGARVRVPADDLVPWLLCPADQADPARGPVRDRRDRLRNPRARGDRPLPLRRQGRDLGGSVRRQLAFRCDRRQLLQPVAAAVTPAALLVAVGRGAVLLRVAVAAARPAAGR